MISRLSGGKTGSAARRANSTAWRRASIVASRFLPIPNILCISNIAAHASCSRCDPFRRDGDYHTAPSDGAAGDLLVIINTLWFIKDRSEQRDRGAHTQERDNPSEHAKRCEPPFGFLLISAPTIADGTAFWEVARNENSLARWNAAEAQVFVWHNRASLEGNTQAQCVTATAACKRGSFPRVRRDRTHNLQTVRCAASNARDNPPRPNPPSNRSLSVRDTFRGARRPPPLALSSLNIEVSEQLVLRS